MSEIRVRLPRDIAKELKIAPKTGLFKDEGEFIKEAVELLLSARKDVRSSIALELYKEGSISLGRLAELLDASYEEAKEILASKKIPIRRGSESVGEVKKESEVLLEIT